MGQRKIGVEEICKDDIFNNKAFMIFFFPHGLTQYTEILFCWEYYLALLERGEHVPE